MLAGLAQCRHTRCRGGVDVGGWVYFFPDDNENNGDNDQANEHPNVSAPQTINTRHHKTNTKAKQNTLVSEHSSSDARQNDA